MIPSPKLDDRTYADIVAEALRLIPRYCPDWTNHNPSDPGITVLELCAFMTELILTRLNKVPEKNYLAFLDMLGIKLASAQPARALLTFDLVENVQRQVLRKGQIQVSTPQTDDEETVVFEITRDLTVMSAKLDRCFSYFDESYSDNSHFLPVKKDDRDATAVDRSDGFLAFAGAERVDRCIYLGDDRLGLLSENVILRLQITAPEHGGRDLARLLEWEYWNGRRWRELRRSPVEPERGEVIFVGPPDIQKETINGVSTFWLRGRLVEVPKRPEETEVDTVKAIIEVSTEQRPGDEQVPGLLPDQAFSNLDRNFFTALDFGKRVHPFGEDPKPDNCLYLASQEAFLQEDVDVEIEFALADPKVVPPPVPSDELILSWEYFDGKKWRILGKTTPRGKAPPGYESNDHGFVDATNAFTRSGLVRFRRPKDLKPGTVSGEINYWIRVRLEIGDYGRPGSYELDGDKWVWKDEKPLKPPAFRSLGIRYTSNLSHLRYFVSYNDFQYTDHSDEEKNEYKPFQPFRVIPDKEAALYLGWDQKLPNETVSIFIQMVDKSDPEKDRTHAEHLQEYYARREALWEADQRVVWEYFNGQDWMRLPVTDGTKNLIQDGFLDFLGPDDMEKTMKFAEERFWIRARLEHGGYSKPPRIRRVLTNTVEAMNVRTVVDEYLGSSDGTPLQTFTFLHGPMVGEAIVDVREREEPKAEEIKDLGPGAVVKAEDKDGGWFVRWRCVESFFESGPRSRHYTLDPHSRTIAFGDDKQGMVPPQMRNSVIARQYLVGGGSRGNVNAGQLTVMTRAVAYIEKVTNLLPAFSGADPETVEQAKHKAPLQLKTRDRAVTAEDFETLALRSSTGIARAKCLPSDEKSGYVSLVIIPRADERNQDLTRKLVPSPELCRFVKHFLDERRLLTTIVDVDKPRYVELSLKVTLIRRTVGTSERLRKEVETRLRTYLHALHGGKEGKGWPFGAPIYRSDLVHLIEDIPGLEAIDSIAIYDEDRRVLRDSVRLRNDELPFIVNVHVVERVRQEMV